MGKKITKLFWDFEFTGLHKLTTPISLGIVSECGKKFYCEFNDFDDKQVDEWIRDNVLANLLYNEYFHYIDNNEESGELHLKNDTDTIKRLLREWLTQFKSVEFWGDSVVWDWLLMVDLLMEGDTMRKIPKYLANAQPFDVFTLLKARGVNPKEQRHILAEVQPGDNRHNSLYDAEITKKIHDKYI